MLQVTNRDYENTITYHKTLCDIIRHDTTKFSLKATLLSKQRVHPKAVPSVPSLWKFVLDALPGQVAAKNFSR